MALTALALAACSGPVATPAPTTGDRPTLVLFITVDQLRPEYLEQFGSEFDGGFARLLRGGAYFTDAHQDHAITETAPGHASTMSGRFPRSTGITRNLAGVGDPDSPLLQSEGSGASPFRFRGTTLADWLMAADPKTRVLSVSGKDRGAILPVGRARQQVFWYADEGIFTTSTWYAKSLPDWVTQFNARGLARRWAGRDWTPAKGPDGYPEPDSVAAEADGKDIVFPHRFPDDSASAARNVRFTPMGDELTAAFALEGIRRLGLGRGPATDLVAVSFSSTDFVGHFWGPESREQHDQIIRLDRVLGGLLDTLFAIRDSSRVVIALTADHGATKIAELHGKARVTLAPVMGAIRDSITARGGDPAAVDLESGAFFVDSSKLGASLSATWVTDWFLDAARGYPGVLRADRFADLVRGDTVGDPVARRWIHMFAPAEAPVAVVMLEEGNLYRFRSPYPWPVVASHGSIHRTDSHVPIIFFGSAFEPGRYSRFARTVDIAPTLARVLGVTPSERLDGRSLTEALR